MSRPPRTTQLAPPELLLKLERRGYTIDQSEEVQRYLDSRQANAATFLQQDLLLRPDARTVEVLEEYLHNIQRAIGLMEKMTLAELEFHVKEFMLNHRRLLGITPEDAQWLKKWLDAASRKR